MNGFHFPYRAEREALLGCKVVKKVDPEEKVGLVVFRNGRATVAEYSEISKDLIKYFP